ncbi:DUF4230 domain-containing protein [Petrimonas sp.]|uniref:DUF4230 domain-containing protein n=1 Tax=Petrimonas sp. TaxID=2023866 RepID=UPI002FCB2160
MRKVRHVIWLALMLLVLLLAGFVYATFFRPYYSAPGNNTLELLIFGSIAGAVIAFLIFKLILPSASMDSPTNVSSHTVIESIRKVFKIVVAEGQLNEIYNYENTKKLLKFIPSTKKALVIVKAKVLIGYDIEKCKWEVDNENKIIKLLAFPAPEILSLDPDFDYYYFEDDLFNFISRKDLQLIQGLAKEQVKQAALNSGLMKIASMQMKTLLTEMVNANKWQLEGVEKIDNYPLLSSCPQ